MRKNKKGLGGPQKATQRGGKKVTNGCGEYNWRKENRTRERPHPGRALGSRATWSRLKEHIA